jgi:hypothetical protein
MGIGQENHSEMFFPRQFQESSNYRERNGWPHIIKDPNRNIRRSIKRDYIPRDLNSAKSHNCQESCKLSYGMGVGKWKIELMHL